jgi:HlyD family secretion protein
MELLARLSETDLAGLPIGAQAEVTPVGTDRSFVGRVWQVSPVIDATSRQGIARLALPYDPAIRPGGFASARIVRGTQEQPLLPESAVQSDEKGNFVYIVGQGNKVERRPVTTGTVTATGIAITGGLTGTEKVVLRAGGFLNPGETVKPELPRKN